MVLQFFRKKSFCFSPAKEPKARHAKLAKFLLHHSSLLGSKSKSFQKERRWIPATPTSISLGMQHREEMFFWCAGGACFVPTGAALYFLISLGMSYTLF
jgi:hypothetical protein